MIVLLVWLAVMGGVAAYDMNEWKYVGHHECKRVGHLIPEGSTVYPAQVEGEKPYILFKQKNVNGTYTVACIND